METKVTSANKEVIIGAQQATVLIGERINPTGKKKLTASLEAGDMMLVRQEAVSQVEAGAHILDVNVGPAMVDETELLPKVVKAVMEVVDVPISIDSDNPKALEAALKVYRGKPIINSVSGQEKSLDEVLPLVKEYGAAVVALTVDDEGIPKDADRRVAIAHKIIDRAEALGIPREDIIIDCLVLAVVTENDAGLVTLEAVQRVKEELDINQTMGASNISFGLPERTIINRAFLALSISAGITCPYVNAAEVCRSVMATDLVLGRDHFGRRFVKDYRRRNA